MTAPHRNENRIEDLLLLRDVGLMITSDLVHCVESAGKGPVTHAIVFGIGTYPHGRDISSSASLDDLKSPVETARKIADWLIQSYDNPLRPLASVSLVVSADQPFVYRNPVTGEDFEVPPGTTNDFANCVDAWARRAGADFENGSVFYYCGHGLSSGYRDCILTRSFGESPLQHLNGVFERASMVNAMRVLGPKHQLFVFDTCRNETTDLLAGGASLPSLLSPRPGTVPPGEVRQCRLFATAEGRSAFGELAGVSLFSRAFINATQSAGQCQRGEWWVNSSVLHQHLDRFMPDGQVPQLEGPVVNICRIGQTLMVPVVVCCDPDDHIFRVRFELQPTAGPCHHFDGSVQPNADPWSISVETGAYVFGAAACNAGEFNAIEGHSVLVYPPYKDIVVNVVQGTVC